MNSIEVVRGDNGVPVINASEAEPWQVTEALNNLPGSESLDPVMAKLLATMGSWARATKPSRMGGIFDRDRFVDPDEPYEQMRLARRALRDDVIGGAADLTESLALSATSIYSPDDDEQDAWNQWAAEFDMDSRLREAWRVLFTDSQFVAATTWAHRTYQVRGVTPAGHLRRKAFKLLVPTGMTFLDSTKVTPVGTLMFGREHLAYMADGNEAVAFDAILARRDGTEAEPPPGQGFGMGRYRHRQASPAPSIAPEDDIVEKLIVGRYVPSDMELAELDAEGITSANLFLLDYRYVFRHTLTRPTYKRFSDIRLASCFELLDLKSLLRSMDRAHLIGGPLRTDQRVVTPDGWKQIGDVVVGDEVFGPDGKTTRIRGVYPQGWLSMYRVTFSDGAEVVCDGSHRWNVRTPAKRNPGSGQWRTLTLDQIMAEGLTSPNGVGASGRPQIRRRHEVPMQSAIELPEADLPLDPYLLGYLLGNGHFGVGQTPRISYDGGDDRPWENCLPAGVRAVKSRGNPYEFCLSRVEGPGRPSPGETNPVVAGLRSVDLHGMLCRDKFIPDMYLWASIPQRWALLQGLCDSDGSALREATGATFGNASEKLIDGVVELVSSLGGIASKQTYSSNGQPFFIVYVQTPQAMGAPFRLARKVATWSPKRRQLRRTIVSIEHVTDAPAVCISVNRADGLFLTEGFITTHNSNFICLIRKGSDTLPAQQPEIAALRESVNTIAQVPVIVGDHRLSIDIITPKLDVTLNTSRYDLIDRRLTARALGTFVPTGSDQDDPLKLGKVIGRNMESRRRMLRRSFEQHLFQPIRDSNDEISERAKLAFHPATISLSFDSAFASFLLDLREANELSRDTILSQFDLDQRDEARQREREAELYDDTFNTFVPHGANPGNPGSRRDGDGGNDPDGDRPPPGSTRLSRRSGGRQGGGRRNGGGAAPGSGQGQNPVSPRRLSDRAETIEDDLTGLSRDQLIAIAGECNIPYRHQLRRDTLRESIRAVRDHNELHPEGDDQ